MRIAKIFTGARSALAAFAATAALNSAAFGLENTHQLPVETAALESAHLSPQLLDEALDSRDQHAGDVDNWRWVVIIDYHKPSSDERFFLVDTEAGTVETFLVAHGAGSDTNHDQYAEQFSNIPGSRMTSLGAYVTGQTYYGKHGLSLRLHGLERTNHKALERAIVMHGADYVAPGRKLGRSWGCPAVERRHAERLISTIKHGAFFYVIGPGNA